MPYTINQTFADGKLRLARSPLIVVVTDTNIIVNDPSYRFIIEVRAWTGTILTVPVAAKITLRAIPNPNKLGLFNIAPILQDIITPDDPMSTGNKSTAGTWAVQLKYGYIHEGVKTIISTSLTTYFTDGYAISPKPINEYKFFDDINNADAWCTPVKVSDIGRDRPAWLHFYRGAAQGRAVYFRDDSGVQFLYLFGLPPVPLDTEDCMGRAPIGLDDVLAAALIAPVPAPTFNPKNWFECSLIRLDDFSILDRYRINIVDKDFCDIEDDTIAYINRYGVWDYIHFKGSVKETISQERTEWDRRVTDFEGGELVYPDGISQKGVVGVEGALTFTLQTGYVRDYINEKMKDLMLSKTHFSQRLDQSVVLKSKSLDFLKDSNTDLINYTVQFEVAGNIIQNIQ